MMSSWLREALDELARLQLGRIARWQLVGLGMTGAQADVLTVRHGWFPTAYGVVRMPGWPVGPIGSMWDAVLSVTSRHHRQAAARIEAMTALEVHERACHSFGLTGFSAAWLHGMTPNAPIRPQLLLPHPVRRRLPDVHVIRTRRPVVELHLVRGLPTVPPLRLLWDCAQIIHRTGGGASQLRRLASRADGNRLLQAEDLHLVVRDPAAFGLPRTVPPPFRIAASSLAGGHSHSSTEAKGRRIVREVAAEFGLAVSPRPLAVPDEDNPIAEADIAIQVIKLDVEIDGPHHDDPGQQRHDRWRDAQMLGLGWTVRRYRAALVDEDPERFRRLLRADILQAASAAGIPLTARAA